MHWSTTKDVRRLDSSVRALLRVMDLLSGRCFGIRQTVGLAAPAQLRSRTMEFPIEEKTRANELGWDHRQQKRSSRLPGFQEVLRVNKLHKPAPLDMLMGRGARTDSDPSRPEGAVTAETVGRLCEQGHLREAVEALGVLVQTSGLISTTLVYAVLQKCVSTRDLVLGRCVHGLSVRIGYDSDMFLCNHILRMYASHARLQEAMDVFTVVTKPDAFMWSSIISAHVQYGEAKQAIRLYGQMRRSGVKPDGHVFVAALQACARGADLKTGQQVHADVLASEVEPDLYICNCLVDMYAKCGSLEDAQRVFDGLPRKDVVTWNAMIAGCSQQGKGEEALRLYSAMQEQGGLAPSPVTFVSLLQACADVAALQVGRQLHAQIEEQGMQDNVTVATSVMEMYAKSGSMHDAQQVFDALPEKDIVSWSALIAGYTRQGDIEVIFDLIHKMRQDGIEPDRITFLSVLTACSHAGLVNKGREYFEAMSREYGISPTEEHFSCLVDLLGRAGQLDEALAVVKTMPVRPDAAVWRTLLGACRKWCNVDVGRHAFCEAVKLEENDPAAYVLMSNIYTGAEMWQDAEEMQARRKGFGAWKQPGQSSWTDMDGLVHTFIVGDKNHRE